MSSYYPSFSYAAPNGVKYNSFKDKKLIVVHFESGDEGEMDTFLEMEPVYVDNAYGTRRLDYGARYTSVATIRISVMKANGHDFTMAEVRDFLRWTTGSRKISYLDLVDGEEVKASFLGRITKVFQQKLDARTVGFVVEHTSISPWAYSPIQHISCSFGQELEVDENGVLIKNGQYLTVDENGTLSNGSGGMLSVTNDGTVYIDNSVQMQINNLSDDLSSYVYLDTVFTNSTSGNLIIKNQTLYEESDEDDGLTEITGMHNGEVIQLTSEQFITSSNGRMLGNSFNFIWPKLIPGVNEFIISGTGEGSVEFTYRYPIKIGDCAMDISVSNGDLCCGDYSDEPNDGSNSNRVTWDQIINKPSTIQGYGITDAYTISEVNNKLSSVDMSIDENELNNMLEDVL